MTETQLNQREIKWTKCDTNGHIATGNCPHHYYIIITMNGYNLRAEEVLGVPLTSQENEYTLNYGIDITNDDITDGQFQLSKKTYILCDRPCRIRKNHLKMMSVDGSRISDDFFQKILNNINHFMRYGKSIRS